MALETNRYPQKNFLLDLIIVLALFVSYDSVHLDDRGLNPEIGWIAGSLFVSYVAFRAWRHSMRTVIGSSTVLGVYETAMAIGFFLVALWRNVYALGGALIVSALLMSFIGKPIVRRFHEHVASGQPAAQPDGCATG